MVAACKHQFSDAIWVQSCCDVALDGEAMRSDALVVLQDAINMQINNLAQDNLHDKLGILSELVTDEFWPWFANYMVVKRAAQVGRTSLDCGP